MFFARKQTAKIAVMAICLMFLAVNTVWAFGNGDLRERLRNRGIKNVIVMIPDGCDETVQTLARWYKGSDLQVDHMQGGGVKQHMANSVITGSAAAATAFATGHKTTVRFLGVGPRTDDLLTGLVPTADPYAPVASILEAAKLRGKATGVVATSRVTHATPAAFACHIEDRGWDNDIMEHMVYNNINVVFGGGARHLLPADETYVTSFGDSWSGKRTDGDNLLDVLKNRGYEFVDSKAQMDAVYSGKVWGLFDDSHMDPDLDRKEFHPTQPSLAEMTAKAIDLLSQDPDGFFLMVEGSQVDWAGHANDPIYMLTDFLAFDEAVKVACDFADENGQTLVMAYPDHNTGGMKIGHYFTSMGYTETTVEDLVDPLKGMTLTAGGLASKLENDSVAEIAAKVEEYWNLDITEEEAQDILDYQAASGRWLSDAIAHVISKNHTVVGWTTHGHNGETVPLWMHGAEAPVGIIDNIELAEIAADAMHADLDRMTERLYVDLDEAGIDYELVGDTAMNDYGFANNLVVKVKGAELPVSKDYMDVQRNGFSKRVELPGVTVYAPATDKVYVSRKAVFVLNRLTR